MTVDAPSPSPDPRAALSAESAGSAAAARPMRIVYAASEAAPFAKTGGLADVAGAFPRALTARGHTCAVVMPLFRCAREAGQPIETTAHVFEIPIGNRRVVGRLCRSRLPGSDVPVYLIEQPEYFERDDRTRGLGIYQQQLPSGRLRDYPDNSQRFIFFCRAVLESLPALGFTPDVLHCNDWQSGLIPVYLRELDAYRDRYPELRTLLTIHNLAYQGVFWHWDMAMTGLPWKLFNLHQLEFYGQLNFLKGGIVYADRVNAVSPTYAEEIQTPEYGCGLEGVLQHCRQRLTGIMNGVEYAEWDPRTDRHIAARYNVDSAEDGKAACKRALQQRMGLPERPDVPLLAVIARLVDQKVGLLPDVVEDLHREEEVQVVVLGLGDPAYHRLLKDLADQQPARLAVTFAFDEPLAHQIEAGADMFLMPSKFEPSGLNQLYSLRYGTVPVVRDTGGLHDSVTDCTPQTLAAGTATGFTFGPYIPIAFLAAIQRAVRTYHEEPATWRKLIRTGMTQDWSWDHSAAEYEREYQNLRLSGPAR